MTGRESKKEESGMIEIEKAELDAAFARWIAASQAAARLALAEAQLQKARENAERQEPPERKAE